MSDQNEQQIRQNKLDNLIKAGMHPYPEKFDKQYDLSACPELKEGISLSTAGRLIMFRDMGKITFAHLQDSSGKFQVVFKKDVVGDNEYKLFIKNIDLGDHIGIEGEIFTTQKGEISILVRKWTFLGKALLPLPEKWHGLKDREVAYRQRYLDLISNPEAMTRFQFRSNFIKALREFYWSKGFSEVETQTLCYKATGAHAQPYKTHNNALDMDVYLRISHELPLKELIVGGFEKIFELGKAFRNEGHDPSHLPEHTHLEHYAAYWNFEDNMKFTEDMIDYLFVKLKINKKIDLIGRDEKTHQVNWSTPFKRVNFIELLKHDTKIDIRKYDSAKDLLKDIKKAKIEFEGMSDMSLAGLVDNLYKKVSRPQIINPT